MSNQSLHSYCTLQGILRVSFPLGGYGPKVVAKAILWYVSSDQGQLVQMPSATEEEVSRRMNM
jgi:hypothetical protein